MVPRLDPDQPAAVDRGDPAPGRADRRPAPRLVHLPVPATVRGGPHHLDPSTAKAARDEHARRSRIEAGTAAIDELTTRLAGPRTRLRTRATVEQAAAKALADNGSARWTEVTVTETIEESFPAREPRTTRLRHPLPTHHPYPPRPHLDHPRRSDRLRRGQRRLLPLITNDRDMTDKDVLDAYRYQPNLERRHHLLKSVQNADPIWLRDPARIEAIFCCQFLALLFGALIERQIRTAMRDARTADIPIYPELRACEAPSAERIFAVFAT